MSATVMDTLPDNKGAGPKLKGKHILFILLGFFGIVFAVNGYFAYSALHTFPGELRGATYEAGLRYNQTLAKFRAQTSLQWSYKAQFLSNSAVALTFTAADGSPVTGLAIEGWLERPSTAKADRRLSFKEVAAGRYEAAVETPMPGTWTLAFAARKDRPGDSPIVYRIRERVWKRMWNGAAS